MKTRTIRISIEQPKHRAHRVLFQEGTPFRMKVVRDKTQYTRKTKHRGRDE